MNATHHDLLFGLLALQNGLIDQGQLVAAFQAWTRDKVRPLAELLIARGDLDSEQRAGIEAMVALHRKKHGSDSGRSLAAIPAGRSTRESLARIGDPEIGASLGHVGSAHRSTEDGDVGDRTATYSVGSATSDGLRFRVVRPHARGGLGAVLVALDTELHREVALKQILDSHADDPTSRQRFLLEAEVTGGLEHPGIVPVYGLGTYGDGRPYYAMRFIRGDSLKEAIEHFHTDASLMDDHGRRSLELRKLLRRFLDVCNAIEYAHSRGVLHRDIKPGNIIVGKHGETLVVDWGLAKPLGRVEPGVDSGERVLIPSSASGSASTLPGSALGTPAYMSPEQSEGDLEHLGPRSDVYSLGATLYCLLTGKPPFEGDLADVIRRVQKGQFPPPRQIDPSIDRALEAVCLMAMALKPADRYGSPNALADDVEQWMADEPVAAWREPWTRLLIRWLTQHRVGVTAAGAAMLVALVGTLTVLGVQTRANAALKAANTELAIANKRVTQVNADLAAANQRERARFALAQEAIQTFHTGVSEDVLLKQEEFKALRAKLLRGAREFYRKLEGLLQRHADRESRMSLGRAYLEVGQLTRQLDSIEEALKVHERAVGFFDALSREDLADTETRHMLARSLQSLTLDLTTVGRRDEADTAMERSRALVRTLAEAEPAARKRQAEWGRSEIFYSGSLLAKGRHDEAQEAIQRAQAILETPVGAGPPTHDLQPELLNVYCALGDVLDEVGRQDEAIVAYAKARDVGEALFLANPKDPATSQELVRTLGNWGICLRDTGRRDEALVAFDRAREVLKVAGGANPTLIMFRQDSAWIDTAAAEALVALGRDMEALVALERARAAREMLIKANPVVTRNREQLIRTNSQIVDIHRRAGRISDALASLERAREFAASMVDAHPENREYRLDLAMHDTDLGDLLGAMRKPAEALARLDEALLIHRALVQANPSTPGFRSNLADMLRRIGVALQKCGRLTEAVSALRQSLAELRGLTAPSAGDYYCATCVQSVLSGVASEAGSGLTAAEGRAAADAAMAALHQAVAAGWRDPAWAWFDPALVPIRSRPDFQLLFMDLAFPTDPFASGR